MDKSIDTLDFREGFPHWALVFMSWVKDPPQETALGLYCTTK